MNLRAIRHIHICTVRGYEFYVPEAYKEPSTLFKKDCPLWIKRNSAGDCIVYFLSKDLRQEGQLDRHLHEVAQTDIPLI